MKYAEIALKRLLDLCLALMCCVLLLPVFVILAVLIKLDSDGSVLYKTPRVGRDGRLFIMYKFRSMVLGAHAMLKELAHLNQGGDFMIKIPDDPRVTRVGKFLRKHSLDELPQLFNVLRGQMSLVGPRPQAPNEVALYTPHQRRRLETAPGITGLWQVSARDDPRFEVWVAKDLEYIDNWSLWLDFKILLKTVGVVLAGKDAAPKTTLGLDEKTHQPQATHDASRE